MTPSTYAFIDYTKISSLNIFDVTPHRYFYTLIGIVYAFLLLPTIQLLPELQNWGDAEYALYSQYMFYALLFWNITVIVSIKYLLDTFFRYLRVRHFTSLQGINRFYVGTLLILSAAAAFIPFAQGDIRGFLLSFILMLLARQHINHQAKIVS